MQRFLSGQEKKYSLDSYISELKIAPAATLPDDQDWIIILMESLGFLSNRKGVCFGAACSAIEFMLTRDIKKFNQFSNLLYFIYKTSLDIAHKKLSENYADEFKLLETKDKKIEFFINLIKEEILIHFEKIPKIIQIEINAFLTSIELYHQAFMYPHLFSEDKLTPKGQNMLLTVPLVLSRNIEKLGGIEEAGYFHGYNYDLNESNEFLKRLQLHLEKKIIGTLSSLPSVGPVTLLLVNPNIEKYHAIAVAYDLITSMWTIIDIESLPAKILTEDKQISANIFESISLNNSLDFEMHVYITANDKHTLKRPIIEWCELESLKQTINAIKADRGTMRFYALEKLKEVAAESKNNTDLEKELDIFSQLEDRHERLRYNVKNKFISTDKFKKISATLNDGYRKYSVSNNLTQREMLIDKVINDLSTSSSRSCVNVCHFFYRSTVYIGNFIKNTTNIMNKKNKLF